MEKVLELIDDEVIALPLGNPRFSDSRYRFVSLSKDNLNPLEIKESNKKISFIDGGNYELMAAPTFSIHLVRIYFNLFQGKTKLIPKKIPPKIEFYSLSTTALAPDGEIEYKTSFFPLDDSFKPFLPQAKDLFFNSYDETLREGLKRGKINKMGGIARRFAEWHLISFIASHELENGDMIVRDGSLQTSFTNEALYSKRAYQECQAQNVLLTGLSKTSSLYTTSGNTLIGAIHQLGKKYLPQKSWYYHPIVEITHPDHPAEMFCLKLHPLSEYVFRWEVLKSQINQLKTSQLKEFLSVLAKNSSDISFPGYPYGLIDADSNARIRRSEADYHTTLFLSQAGKKERWEKLVNHIKAIDAHHHLNKIIGK